MHKLKQILIIILILILAYPLFWPGLATFQQMLKPAYQDTLFYKLINLITL